VDRASDDLLARTALTGNQHAATAVRDLADQREDLAHRRALPDQVTEGTRLIERASQAAVFLF